MNRLAASDLGELDRASGDPLYRQIADRLLDLMATGALASGDMLPSTPELSRHFGVAPMTIREALNVLRAEGRIVSEKGKGVYVDGPPPLRVAMRTLSFDASVLPPLTGALPKPPDLADVLAKLATGDLRVTDSLALSDRGGLVSAPQWLGEGRLLEIFHKHSGQVFAVSRYVLPEALAHGGSVTESVATLCAVADSVDGLHEEVLSRMPTRSEAADLLLPREQPVLVTRHVGLSGGVEVIRAETVRDGRAPVTLVDLPV
ncbi:GntR family transcriptional regulator [Microbacterium sp. M1A1_1b]